MLGIFDRYGAAAPRLHRPRKRYCPSFETVESRRLLTNYAFINQAGGSWYTAANWSPQGIPTDGDSVSIPALDDNAAVYDNQFDSLTLADLSVDGILAMNGSLTVTNEIAGTGTFILNGSGTLSNTTIAQGMTVEADQSSGTLDGVTLAGSLLVAGGTSLVSTAINVENGLILNGGTIILGNANAHGQLVFAGTQSLSGNGTVVVAGSDGGLAIPNSLQPKNLGTLTIEQGITVQGASGVRVRLGGPIGATAQVVDYGSINVDGKQGDLICNSALSLIAPGSLSLLDGAGASAALTNAGTVTIGPGSLLDGLSQTSAGILNLQIDASSPLALQTNEIVADGLAGTLNVTFVNGTPEPGQKYFIASGGPDIGTFDSVNGGTLEYDANTHGTGVYLVTPTLTSNVTVVSAPNPSTYGQAVTFTATVSPASAGQPTPTGTVTFMDGSTTLGPGTLDASGVSTFTTSTLAVGIHSITAVYGGDNNFSNSTSVPISQNVQSPPQIVLNLASEIRDKNFLDPNHITIIYTISNADVAQPLGFDVFQSDKPYTDIDSLITSVNAGSATPLGHQVIDPSNLSQGTHTATLALDTHTPIVVDPTKPYIVVVADLDGSIAEASGSVNIVSTQNSPPYTPDQIRAAYGLPSIEGLPLSWSGIGQTIAIVVAYSSPTIQTDLAAFDSQFNLPGTTVNDINQFLRIYDLSPVFSNPPPQNTPGAWGLEASLDVEWAHAIAPLANIDLVEAVDDPANEDTFGFVSGGQDTQVLFDAVNAATELPGVSVVSMSWGLQEDSGFGENDETSYDNYMKSNGISFVASSGDHGNPNYPALSPNVLAVGGTTLTFNADGSPSESGWSGSGGGTSLPSYESEPQYQSQVQSTGSRSNPDVAFDGDLATGVYVYDAYDKNRNQGSYWFSDAGTSLGAPCWAALLAIVNQNRTTPLGGEALPALYEQPSSYFNQIGGAYNTVTGLGTPKAYLLIPALAAWNPVTINTSAVQPATAGTFYTQAIFAGGSDGQSKLTLTPAWSVYPAGLTLDNSKNNEFDITGTPTAVGIYTFNITATDPFGVTMTRSFTLTINPLPTAATSPRSSPAAPQATGIANVSHSRKGLSLIAVAFNEALNGNAVNILSLYSVHGGVKKHGKTIYSKNLRIRGVSYDSVADAVSIRLAKPYKGVVQVTVRRGILAANGMPSDSEFSMIAR